MGWGGILGRVRGPRERDCPHHQAALAAVIVVGALLISGCTAPTISGIGATSSRAPEVRNCGTWIRRVEVANADSGQLVWSAHDGSPDNNHDVARVTLGVLPNSSWVEDSALTVAPRPMTWSFKIDLGGRIDTLVVTDDMIQLGHIARPGHAIETAGHFRDDTCGYGAGPLYI